MNATDDITDRLADHVSIRSVFPDEERYARFVEKRLTEIGAQPYRQQVEDGRYNVIGSIGEGSVTVGLYGHLDTVPPAADWEDDPFQLDCSGDRLVGLGACDMKAGNLAILSVCEAVAERSLECELRVAFGVDEEYMSKGSTRLLESGVFDDVDIILVPEPADRSCESAVVLGRRGRISIDVEVSGVPAHAATPEEGESAIRNGVRVIDELDAVALGTDPALGDADLTIRSFESDAGALSIPDTARIILDRHMVPGETVDHCLEQVRLACERAGVDASVQLRDRPTPYLRPYKTEVAGLAEQFVATVSERFGSVDRRYGRSVADENRFAEAGVPVVTYGPIGGRLHQGGEWVTVSSIESVIQTYMAFLESV